MMSYGYVLMKHISCNIGITIKKHNSASQFFYRDYLNTHDIASLIDTARIEQFNDYMSLKANIYKALFLEYISGNR